MRFLFVLIAILILEPTHQQYQRSVPSCSENGETFCSSCSTSSLCILSAGTLTQYNTTCNGTTVCGTDASDPPNFACAENANADCMCTGTTGLSYKSDPYSDQWYILCGGSSPAYIDCGPGLFYNEAEHNCVNYPPSPTTTTTTTTTTPAPSICTVSGAGAHDYPDTCDTFYVCTSSISEPINGTCLAPTNYFDPVSNECREPPARFICPPEVVGTLGDPYDCRRYYVCFNVELFDVGCCGLSEVFNEQIGSCVVGTAPPGCPLSDECAEAFTTDNTIAGMSVSTSSNSVTPTTNSPSASIPEGITSTSTITSTLASTPDGITSTSTTTSISTSTSDGITWTSFPRSSTSTSDGITSASSSSSLTSTFNWITSTFPTSSSTYTSDEITLTSTSTNTEITTTTEASTTISTTTNEAPSCTPTSNFECPAPDGFFPQCNYCAKTYFHCVSSSATLGTCTGNTVFNTVTTYPSCIPPEYCPYYP